MKKLFFLSCLAFGLGILSGCVKEDPNPEKGIFGHSANYTIIAQTPNTITVRINSTTTFSANALKAGETYPKVGETDPNKGRVELDIKKILEDQGLPITKQLISIKLVDAVVTLDAARCNAVSFTIKNFSLPVLLQGFSAVKSVACDASAINAALVPFKGVEYAAALKAGGKVVVEYSYTANADMPANANAASIALTTMAVLTTSD